MRWFVLAYALDSNHSIHEKVVMVIAPSRYDLVIDTEAADPNIS